MSKAKPDAWMPLYVADWDADTRHLNCEEDGAYGRLVRHYWRNGPLPDNDTQLARIVGMDLRRWRKMRPVIAGFFVINEGKWRHKRVDDELVRWAERRQRAIERAAAGGRAKAAKGCLKHPASTPEAVLKGCTSSSSREVEAPKEASTLSERGRFDERADGSSSRRAWLGPSDVRQAFVEAQGEAWTASYVDPCQWQDVPERALIPATQTAGARIVREGRKVLQQLGLCVLERAA
jgi:uncharacterized protein YdaU (DUF1376 family)